MWAYDSFSMMDLLNAPHGIILCLPIHYKTRKMLSLPCWCPHQLRMHRSQKGPFPPVAQTLCLWSPIEVPLLHIEVIYGYNPNSADCSCCSKGFMISRKSVGDNSQPFLPLALCQSGSFLRETLHPGTSSSKPSTHSPPPQTASWTAQGTPLNQSLSLIWMQHMCMCTRCARDS